MIGDTTNVCVDPARVSSKKLSMEVITMHRKVLFILGVIAVTAVANTAPSFAEEKGKTVVDIGTVDCRRLLKMSGDERDFTLTFYHGFMSGMKQEMVFDAPALSRATDQVIDHCIDNPNDTLLEVFKAKRP
jgi:hypothetical protein